MTSSSVSLGDFVFHRVKDEPVDQVRDAHAIDGKLLQLFSTASILIGLAGFSSSSTVSYTAGAFVIAAIASYGLGALVVLLALPLRLRRQPTGVADLHEDDGEDLDRLERELADNTQSVARHNLRLLDWKQRAFRIALISTGAEVAFIGFSFVSVQMRFV